MVAGGSRVATTICESRCVLSCVLEGDADAVCMKFEEYITAALASVKYGDFLTKGENSGVLITPGSGVSLLFSLFAALLIRMSPSGGDANTLDDFNPIWIAEFKRTNAFDVWQRITDPMLFDIVEPRYASFFWLYRVNLLILLHAHRHPCNEKPSAIADITLRLSEGIQELKLEQQLAPTREAISRTITAGSANFFKAVEGVKGRFVQRSASSLSVGSASTSSGTVISSSEVPESSALTNSPSPPPTISPAGVEATTIQAKERLSGWGASVGTFFSSRAARFSAQNMPSSSMSAPSSTAGSLVPSQDAPWMQNLRASISSSTGNVKLPPRAVQTPPPGQTVAAELGEKTPRENTFSLDGDAGSQSHTPKHEDEKTQDGYDGDSDEELSFGVALAPVISVLV
jgi:hypothetical protein